MKDFYRVLMPAATMVDNRREKIFIEIEYKDGRLSISGIVGPRRNGNARGGCGQIDMEFAHRNPEDNDARYAHPVQPSELYFAKGWNAGKWLDLLDAWKRWHLNDMRAGCKHQRELGWDKEPIDPSKPTTAYGKFYPGQDTDSWNLKMWVYPPHGYLTKPCPVCGYRYSMSWLKEDVPESILEFMLALPESDVKFPWEKNGN